MIKKRRILTSETEMKDLFIAWAIITIAFANVLNGGNFVFWHYLVISAVAVGIGFILHEMGHKIVAQHYHCWAEFRANMSMLLVALFMSFFGFVFAAPGAVIIMGRVNRQQNGKISMAGPLVNLIFAVLFLPLLFLSSGFLMELAKYGFLVNTWLGLFNLIPFGIMDGAKILRWSSKVYGAMVFMGFILLIIGFSLGGI
ncbi:hypothetical protein JW949_00500 [Candidatus Woesearchaeota archaeon]|jgi:Zn-dependent protease|nr:hypothetical protein [Candidatus Woesearchaeota archaeon]